MGFASQRHGPPTSSHSPVAIARNYPIVITVIGSLPGATVGTPYSASLNSVLSVSGGPGPFMWSVISGALPTGLGMDTSGNITGTPSATGTFNFTVQVIDILGNVGTISVGVVL
jgi:hypothetical protein